MPSAKLPPLWDQWDEEAKKYDAKAEKKEVNLQKADISRYQYKNDSIMCGNVGWQGPQLDELLQALQNT